MVDRLNLALAEAVERVRNMTPEQRAEMYRLQRRSFMRAEASFGTDEDEAAYSRAVAYGDEATIARLEAEASARIDAVEKYINAEERS